MAESSLVPKIVTESICALTGKGHDWKHRGQKFERVGKVESKIRFILRDEDECTECQKKRLIPIVGDK